MKLLSLISAMWLVASCPSWAGDQEKRFLEFPTGKDTTTYDLSTVHMIQPGRFTIISITIDNPDVMKLELKVLVTLRTYCARAAGEYPAPPDLFTLGPPDMPVKNIRVKDVERDFKVITWPYPYQRLEQTYGFLDCKRGSLTEDELFSEFRTGIMSGLRTKTLYDCKRGLWGNFVDKFDDPAKAITGFVPKGTRAFDEYLSVCRAVTHEAPYVPE
jgi:hypothetical protein